MTCNLLIPPDAVARMNMLERLLAGKDNSEVSDDEICSKADSSHHPLSSLLNGIERGNEQVVVDP